VTHSHLRDDKPRKAPILMVVRPLKDRYLGSKVCQCVRLCVSIVRHTRKNAHIIMVTVCVWLVLHYVESASDRDSQSVEDWCPRESVVLKGVNVVVQQVSDNGVQRASDHAVTMVQLCCLCACLCDCVCASVCYCCGVSHDASVRVHLTGTTAKPAPKT
jgi:hypothetical protein